LYRIRADRRIAWAIGKERVDPVETAIPAATRRARWASALPQRWLCSGGAGM